MAKLVCQSCKAEETVPVVHCGPAVPRAGTDKLWCPMEGHTENVDIPNHCGLPMIYVE